MITFRRVEVFDFTSSALDARRKAAALAEIPFREDVELLPAEVAAANQVLVVFQRCPHHLVVRTANQADTDLRALLLLLSIQQSRLNCAIDAHLHISICIRHL